MIGMQSHETYYMSVAPVAVHRSTDTPTAGAELDALNMLNRLT
jgi:hypothetical protein